MKFAALFMVLALALPCVAQKPEKVDAAFFETRVKPILQKSCLGCHGVGTTLGGLDLRTRAGAQKGGTRGAALGSNAAQSKLYHLITGSQAPLMPPGGKLPANEIAVMKTWLDSGAPWGSEQSLGSAQKQVWWSLRPLNTHFHLPLEAPFGLSSHTLPFGWVPGSAKGKVQRLASGQRAEQWRGTGVDFPPSQRGTSESRRRAKERSDIQGGGQSEVIDSFIAAKQTENRLTPSKEASRRVLIRRVYADLWGLPPAPEDVEAFVTDPDPKAYEKLVDKLLASPSYGERWGRHWLDLARYVDSGGFEGDKDRPLMWRYRDWVIDAFNSDMPYDKFLRFQIAGDELRPSDPNALIATGYLACGPQDIVENNARTRANELDDLVSTTGSVMLGLTVGCARCHDHKYDPIAMTDYYRLSAVFAPTERREVDGPGGKIQAVTDKGRTVPSSHLLRRGDAYLVGPEVKPGFLASLPEGDITLGEAPLEAKTTRRRVMLAQWLTSEKNPLTARVMVNRIWMHHFGRGLVNTPSNFGVNGELPSHPELLDWLASQFMQSGWSIKKMHRLMLLSKTYRQASTIRSDAMAKDPLNRFLWRMPLRRLEGEAVRDAILTVAGTLNLERGGPPVYPPVDPSLRADTFQGMNWPEGEDSPKTWRRSVYVKVKRSLLLPQLEVFDCPEITYTVEKRNVTTTPLQALTLLNDPLILKQAGFFAERLQKERPNNPVAQIERAYQLCVSRTPTATELKLSQSFLKTRSLTEFCHSMLNLNEFVYVP